MFTILIASDNVYYRKGLESLINESGCSQKEKNITFISSASGQVNAEFSIIFRDMMVSVFLQKQERLWYRQDCENRTVALHIPFICRGENLPEITGKLKKIMTIAAMNYADISRLESYKIIGLKDFMQLSLTESKVMLLIGKGYDTEYISKMLNRSEKTINTHCRNAIRKMGMLNRVEFYKYASFIAHCSNKEWDTLCL